MSAIPVPDFYITQGNLLPEIEMQLDGAPGTPTFDLSTATVKFFMRPVDSPTVKINASATITDATKRRVKYTWVGTDTDTQGDYYAECEVTFSGGKKQTFPSGGLEDRDGFLLVRVKSKIA